MKMKGINDGVMKTSIFKRSMYVENGCEETAMAGERKLS